MSRRRQHVSQPLDDLKSNGSGPERLPHEDLQGFPLPRSQTPRPQPEPIGTTPEPTPESVPEAEEAEFDVVEWRPALRPDSQRKVFHHHDERREAVNAIAAADEGEESPEASRGPEAEAEAAAVAAAHGLEPGPAAVIEEEDAAALTPDVGDPSASALEELPVPESEDMSAVWDQAMTAYSQADSEAAAEEAEEEDPEQPEPEQPEPEKREVIRSRQAQPDASSFMPLFDPADPDLATLSSHVLTAMSDLQPGQRAVISLGLRPDPKYSKNAKAYMSQVRSGDEHKQGSGGLGLGDRLRHVARPLLRPFQSDLGLIGKLISLPFRIVAFIVRALVTGQARSKSKTAEPVAAPVSEADKELERERKEEVKRVNKQIQDKRQAKAFFKVSLNAAAFSVVNPGEEQEEAEELDAIVEGLTSPFASISTEYQSLKWQNNNANGIDVLQATNPDEPDPALLLSNVELASLLKVPDETLRHVPGVTTCFSRVKPLHPRVHPHIIPDHINPPKGLVPIGRLTTSTDGSAIGVENSSLDKHMIVVGRAGSGKSVTATHNVNGVVKAGHPIVVLDPHGQLADDILRGLVAYCPERLDDIVVINISDIQFPPGLNPLAIRHLSQVPGAVHSTLKLLENKHGFADATHPQARQYAHIVLDAMATMNVRISERIAANRDVALLEAAALPEGEREQAERTIRAEAEAERKISLLTPMHMTDFLLDGAFRKPIVEVAEESGVPNVYDYFNDDDGTFTLLSEQRQSEIRQPIQRVFAALHNDKAFTRTLCMDNRLDFAEMINANKIVLCRLGRFGSGANLGQILAQMMLSEILGSMEKWGRVKDPLTGEVTGRGLRLFIDELPAVAKGNEDELGQILAEARKYDFGLIGYAQFLDQLAASLQKELKANTSSKISLKLDPEQARIMASNIGKPITDQDIADLPLYTAYAKLIVDERTGEDTGPFALNTLPPLPAVEDPSLDPDMPGKLQYVIDRSHELIANQEDLADKRLANLKDSAYRACIEVFNEMVTQQRQAEPAFHEDLSSQIEESKDSGSGTLWQELDKQRAK